MNINKLIGKKGGLVLASLGLSFMLAGCGSNSSEIKDQPERSSYITNPRVETSAWDNKRIVHYRNNVILLFTLGNYGRWSELKDTKHKMIAEQGTTGEWKLFLNLDGKDYPNIVMTERPKDKDGKIVFKPDAMPVWLTQQQMLYEMQIFEIGLARDKGYSPREDHNEEDYLALIAKHGGLDTPENHVFRILNRKLILESYSAGAGNNPSPR